MTHHSNQIDQDIKLSPDQQKYLAEKLRVVALAVHTSHKSITESGSLSVDLLKSLIANVEFALSDISKTTGIQSESADEIEERFAQIRAANDRIRSLEQQLGSQASAAVTQQALGALNENLSHWWDKFGFGYVSEVEFGQFGCQAKLSCRPAGLGLRSTYSETPVSDEASYAAWLEGLGERGFVLTYQNGRRDPDVLDTPLARESIFTLLREHIPSSKVRDISVSVNRQGECVLRDIKIYVRDLEDLAKLSDLLVNDEKEPLSKRSRPTG